MPKIRPLPLALAVALALAALPAAATTYMMVSDEQLAIQAPAIAEVNVESVDFSPEQEGWPATDYLVSVDRMLKGNLPGSSIIVRVPGGERPGGLALKIWGAPDFAAGDRAILFLAPNQDGSFRVLHLMLGAFREAKAADGTWLAVRDLSETTEVKLPGTPDRTLERGSRDLAKFREWLADRAAGFLRPADYFTSRQPLQSQKAPATFFTYNGKRLRWFEFDQRQTVSWRAHSAGQPGVNGGGFDEFKTALNTWNGAANIKYGYAGETSATAGLDDYDGTNAILFDHALDSAFSCDSGGVLAIGGPWYDPGDTGTYNGETYVKIGGADIVTNAGLGCFFESSPNGSKAAAELFTHELGHTLGLGHSCGDRASGACAGHPDRNDAIMRANIHDDGRGSRLGTDDLDAIHSLYGGSTGPTGRGPAAPGNLKATVSGKTIRLDWQDRSSNEKGFRIYRGVNDGALTLLATVGPNIKTYTNTGLAANTKYTYVVASYNNKGETKGPQVVARTPR